MSIVNSGAVEESSSESENVATPRASEQRRGGAGGGGGGGGARSLTREEPSVRIASSDLKKSLMLFSKREDVSVSSTGSEAGSVPVILNKIFCLRLPTRPTTAKSKDLKEQIATTN